MIGGLPGVSLMLISSGLKRMSAPFWIGYWWLEIIFGVDGVVDCVVYVTRVVRSVVVVRVVVEVGLNVVDSGSEN